METVNKDPFNDANWGDVRDGTSPLACEGSESPTVVKGPEDGLWPDNILCDPCRKRGSFLPRQGAESSPVPGLRAAPTP